MTLTQTQAKAVPSTSPFAPHRDALLQRKCACGGPAGLSGQCEECQRARFLGTNRVRLQTKLAVGERGDRYEQEADRIAAQMLASEGPRRAENGTGHISRDGHWPVGPTAPANVPPIIHEVLNSPGQPLDEGTRSFFEPRFGHDFSQVRVHADSKATESAKAVDAFAYTVAPHIVFSRDHFAPSSLAGRSLIAHELTHIVQQSQSSALTIATSAAPVPAPGIEASAIPALANPQIRPSQAAGMAMLQRSPAPAEPKKQPTDDELRELLNRFDPGAPVVLYHVDAGGALTKNIQEKGRNFSLSTGGEFNLTTTVEARTGFKGGRGLNNIIAFYLNSRFVSLLQELALSQRGAGAVQDLFTFLARLLQDRKTNAPILAVPRFTFEGGGRGQGRALFGTGDYNVAIRSFKGVTEWNRLFKLSIQRIEHLRYEGSLPPGNRLVLVGQLYPVLTTADPGGTPSAPGPGVEGDLPTFSLASGAGSLISDRGSGIKPPAPGAESGETPPSPVSAARPPLPGPVSRQTPLLTDRTRESSSPGSASGGSGGPTARDVIGSSPGKMVSAPQPSPEGKETSSLAEGGIASPVSAERPLLPDPVSRQTPLLTDRTRESSSPGSASGGSGGPTARDVIGSSPGKMVSAPQPSPEGKETSSLAEGGIASESSLARESITKALGERLNEPTSASALGLISEKGEAAVNVGALVVDVAARKLADYITGLQTGKAQDAVSKLIPQILSKVKNRPDLGIIITVAYSQQTPDVFGVDAEAPRTFLWASFDLVPGLTLREAQSHFDTIYPEPVEGELRDYRYEWLPPSSSTESPQNWHSVQWNQSKSWFSRLKEWVQGG